MSLPTIRIYNTLSREIEKFEPTEPGTVKMYVCGPTVYDYTHIGHGRVYVIFDALKRYFLLRGFHVIHIMNITDIDDKIINRAKDENVSWSDVADYYTKDFLEVIRELNASADLYPRVTEHIEDIIEFIKILLNKGYAYVTPSGSVYFNVDKYDDYGKLSRRTNKELWSQELDFLKEKHNPYDFALWKAAKPGEPSWDSPWGKGRPGWHIECSVMSSKYLGKNIDIHGGGTDLIFPHHENERAQSESAFGVKPWVRYWIHVGLLRVGKDKMSKSLGNIIPLKEAIKKWGPHALRLYYLSLHYRKPQEFSEGGVEQAMSIYSRLTSVANLLKSLSHESEGIYSISEKEVKVIKSLIETRNEFHNALSNDFNTAKALAAVMRLTDIVFKEVQYRPKYPLVLKSLQLLREFNAVLGVLDKELYGGEIAAYETLNKVINIIIEVRRELRGKKEYELADKIRSMLEKEGIILMDKGLKTTWIIRKST